MEHGHQIPSMNPIVTLFCMVGGIFTSYTIPIFANIYTWHVPPIFIEVVQMVMWVAVIATSIVTILKYWKIDFNPFKKKGHKK